MFHNFVRNNVHPEFLTHFSPVKTIVIFPLICLCTKVAVIANNMDPDQTAPLGAV